MRYTSDGMKIDHLALAILRREDHIVMVQQQTPHNNETYWVLPGGLVEAGELITDALVREVQEEAGVQVNVIGRLVSLSQIDRPAYAAQTLAFLFEIADWQGVLQCLDPDGEVLCVELVPQTEAISRLQRNGSWPGIQEPLLAYLRGEMQAGAMWFYREEVEGQRLLGALQPAHND
jgi:8-oxo-dGTP diphosphatase